MAEAVHRHRYRQREVQSVAEDRSGQGDRPGSVSGVPEAYCWCLWNRGTRPVNRKAGCPYLSAALGENLPQNQLIAAAKVWNDRLDAWKAERNSPWSRSRRYQNTATPLTFFSSNPRFGRSCVHSGTKPMPRPAGDQRHQREGVVAGIGDIVGQIVLLELLGKYRSL